MSTQARSYTAELLEGLKNKSILPIQKGRSKSYEEDLLEEILVVGLDSLNKSEIGFYPACIMDKTIKNNTKELWNKSSFIITAIDTAFNIITIDRALELPLFYETKAYNYCNTWVCHGKGLSRSNANSLLQLKNVISKNQFEYEIITAYQTEATVEANFAAGRSISFVNPFTFYKPLRNDYGILAEASYAAANNIVMYFPLNVFKSGDNFRAVILCVNNSGSWVGLYLLESTDFITWPEIDASNKIDCTDALSDYIWWLDPYPAVYNNNMVIGSSNVTDEAGNLILPVSLSKVNYTYGCNRIGLLYTSPDFDNMVISDNYFTYSGISDIDSVNWNVSSLYNHNGKIFLAVEVITQTTATPSEWSTWIFEVNLVTMELTLIQKIAADLALNEKWNDLWITTPTLLEINGELMLTFRGYGGTDAANIIPNSVQPIGLMIFDEISQNFYEYFANPIQINPKLTALGNLFYDHGSQNCYISDNGINYALICLNHGSNTYQILPAILNIQNEENINNWLAANNNIVDTAAGLTQFTEARSIATPNATTPAHSLSATGSETNIDLIIKPKGNGAIIAATPDNTATGGNKRGTNAQDLQTARSSADLIASGVEAFAAGSNNKASGSYSAAIGNFSQALANYSAAIGRQAKADKIGQFAIGCGSSNSNGMAQSSIINLYKQTADAVLTEIFTNGSSTRIVLLANNAYSFLITVTAINTAARNQTASFIRRGLIYNNAGTTALEGALQTIGTDIINASLAGIAPTISADDTNDCLKIQVTGKAATTINWIVNVQLAEIGI
ncbi:MAG: hypothetical protein ACOYO1_02535 [Bacteroidales bacterium]